MKIRRVEDLIIKDTITMRKPGEIADDSKLLKRAQKQRRRSTVYIKD